MPYHSPIQFIPYTHDNRTVPLNTRYTYHGCLCVAHVDGWADSADMCDIQALRANAVPTCAHCNGTGIVAIPSRYHAHNVPNEHVTAVLTALELEDPRTAPPYRHRMTLDRFQQRLITARTAPGWKSNDALNLHFPQLTRLVWSSHHMGAYYVVWE